MGNNILIPITSLNTITKIKNHSLQCEYEDHQHVLDHFQKDFMCKRIAIIFIYLEKYNKIWQRKIKALKWFHYFPYKRNYLKSTLDKS